MNKSGNNPVIATPLSPDQGVDIMKLSVAIADRMDMDVKVVHRVITVMMETLESEAFWRCIDDDADDAADDGADDAVDDTDSRPATANEYELESMEDSYELGFNIGRTTGWNDAMDKVGRPDLKYEGPKDGRYDLRWDAEEDEEDYDDEY